ncbi:MAG: hypothetical protein ACTHJ3_14960 [Pararhizobium sp.]
MTFLEQRLASPDPARRAAPLLKSEPFPQEDIRGSCVILGQGGDQPRLEALRKARTGLS